MHVLLLITTTLTIVITLIFTHSLLLVGCRKWKRENFDQNGSRIKTPPGLQSIIGLLWPWPWPLTFWHPKSVIPCHCRADHFCQLASK